MPEVSTQPNTNQPTPQGMNWKNIIIAAVIGGLVVGAGALAFYLYQGSTEETTPTTATTPITSKKTDPPTKKETPTETKDETADWKVYSDSYKGKKLTFKYPKDWSSVDKQLNNEYVDYKVKKGDKLVKFFNNRPTGPGIPNQYPEKKTEDKLTAKTVMAEFDGKQVGVAEYISKIDGSWEIWGYVNEVTFNFSLHNSKVPSDSERSTMLKIVSTFKFLD